MTNVSKHTLPAKTQKELFTQFTKLFSAADERKLSALFDALFTDAEKIMFIKRIAMILMLARGLSPYAIARSLHLSEATVATHRDAFNAGAYDEIVGISRKRAFDVQEFLDTVEVLLRLGLPSYGKDRWKWLK